MSSLVTPPDTNRILTPLMNAEINLGFISRLPKLLEINPRCVYVQRPRKTKYDSSKEKNKPSAPIKISSVHSDTSQNYSPNKKTPNTISKRPVNLKRKSENDKDQLHQMKYKSDTHEPISKQSKSKPSFKKHNNTKNTLGTNNTKICPFPLVSAADVEKLQNVPYKVAKESAKSFNCPINSLNTEIQNKRKTKDEIKEEENRLCTEDVPKLKKYEILFHFPKPCLKKNVDQMEKSLRLLDQFRTIF